jgi:hypothetical protein
LRSELTLIAGLIAPHEAAGGVRKREKKQPVRKKASSKWQDLFRDVPLAHW